MKTCSVQDCGKQARSREWCPMHYSRWQRHGDPTIAKHDFQHGGVCSLEGCRREVLAKGFCLKHYARNYKYGDPKKVLRIAEEGRYSHPMYQKYHGMLQRCYYSKNTGYKNYGGRGIEVCARWRGLRGFDNFLEDMGVRPDEGMTLERINNDGNYEPGNCKWATSAEQVLNRRKFRNNTSGVEGVNWHSRDKKWVARITVNYRKISLGYFKNKEDAVEARKVAENQYRMKTA